MIPDSPPISDSIAWARPEDVGVSRERLARIGARLDADIAAGTLPGAVALVARGGRVVHFKAYGRRDPGRADLMQLDTIFRIYSMTKPIVSLALMMLVEEGRLTLADPLSTHIPAFADVTVSAGEDRVAAERPITVHDLMRHTSGLTYEWLVPGPVSDAYVAGDAGRRSRTNAEQAVALAALPLLSQPGTAWDYGRSTDVVGRLIEIATGKTLGEALAALVFEPLGMMETGFHVPPGFEGRLAEALPVDPDTGEAVQLMDVTRPPPLENGGGGLVSTAADYARFLHMVASGGTLDGHRLVSPGTLGLMLSDHLAPGTRIGSELLPPGYGFGLGFAVRRADGLAPFPGSAGDAFWFGLAGTSFWYDPAEQLYGILMVQAPGRRDRYRDVFRALVYGALTE